MTRRASITQLEAAGKRIADDLTAEADKQSANENHAVAHELRAEARTVERIVTQLLWRKRG